MLRIGLTQTGSGDPGGTEAQSRAGRDEVTPTVTFDEMEDEVVTRTTQDEATPTDTFDGIFSHHTTRANGVRLHYVIGGEASGEGDPVVLLHGWTQTWRGWRKVMPLLAAGGHTVVAPDMRGFGDSEKPAGGYDGLTVAEDVRQLVRGLGFDSFHLVGHDIGGWAAYPLAASHPEAVRTLALVDSLPPGLGFDELSVTEENPLWHMGFHTARDVAEMLVSGREREYLSYFYRAYSYDPAAISEEDVDEYVSRYSAPGGLRGGFEHYRAFFEDVRQNRELAGRGKLGMPVLALGGDHSVGEGALWATREFAEDVRGGAVERCGHFVPDERPRDLAGRLLAFFDEAADARGEAV